MTVNSKSLKKTLTEQPAIVLFVLFVVLMAVASPNFLTVKNLKNVLIDASIYGVTALAMTIAIITGAFDLSVSSNFALSQIMFCTLLNKFDGMPGCIPVSALITLAVCTTFGCINGLVVNFCKIPAFIATMAMNISIKGICLVFTNGNMVSTKNAIIKSIGKGTFLGFSYLTWFYLVVVIIAWYVMKYTRFGRNLYATGGNRKVAELSGINVIKSSFSTFVILGFCAGLSGLLYVCQMRAGSVLYGTDLALTCVACTVVGGTPLTGGKGGVLRTVMGTILIYFMYKGLPFLGLQGYYNTMVRGLVLLFVVTFDAYMNRGER